MRGKDNFFESHLGLVGRVLVADRQPGEQLTAQAFDLFGGKCRLAQRFAQQAEQQRQVFDQRAPAKTGIVHAGAKTQCSPCRFERLEHLLEKSLLRAAQQGQRREMRQPELFNGIKQAAAGQVPADHHRWTGKVTARQQGDPVGELYPGNILRPGQ